MSGLVEQNVAAEKVYYDGGEVGGEVARSFLGC